MSGSRAYRLFHSIASAIKPLVLKSTTPEKSSPSSSGSEAADLAVASPDELTGGRGSSRVGHTREVLVHTHLHGCEVASLRAQLLGQACGEALCHGRVHEGLAASPGTLAHLCCRAGSMSNHPGTIRPLKAGMA